MPIKYRSVRLQLRLWLEASSREDKRDGPDETTRDAIWRAIQMGTKDAKLGNKKKRAEATAGDSTNNTRNDPIYTCEGNEKEEKKRRGRR